MAAIPQVHLYNTGTKFLVLLKDQDDAVITDLNLTSTKKFIFTKPDETPLVVDATFESDGTDGYIYFLTTSTTLDQEGQWTLQVKVIYSNGNTYYSNIVRFRVYENSPEA